MELWRYVLPLQIVCLILSYLVVIPLARLEHKNGAGMTAEEFQSLKATLNQPVETKLSMTSLYFENALTIAILIAMLSGIIKSNLGFMVALAVALVGGSFGAGSYVSTHYGAVAQASETESESETEGTEASTVATASAADGTTYSVQEIVANAMPSMVAITNKGVQEVQSYFYGQTYQQETESTGSGVIIGQTDDELLIATNNHVVSGS